MQPSFLKRDTDIKLNDFSQEEVSRAGTGMGPESGSGAFVLPVHVALVVEVAEEQDEADAVGEHNGVHRVGEVTLGEQVVAGVCGEKNELQLEMKEVVRRNTHLQFTEIFKSVCVCLPVVWR